MSGSNRSARTEAVAVYGFCGVAVFAVLVLIWVLGDLNGKQTEQRYSQPHRHAVAAKSQALDRCGDRNGSAALECIYDAVETSEETARTEQDLTAQQRAAWAAVASAIFAFVSVPIGALGLWALLRSLNHTERALVEARRSADETSRANEQAREQVRCRLHTKEHYFALTTKPADDERWAATFIFNLENMGETSAHRIKIKIDGALLKKRVRIDRLHKSTFIVLLKGDSSEKQVVTLNIRRPNRAERYFADIQRVFFRIERTSTSIFGETYVETYALVSKIKQLSDGTLYAENFTHADNDFASRLPVIDGGPFK